MNFQNVFWSLKGTEIYSALSWDRLHAYNNGLFSDHLLAELKKIISEIRPVKDGQRTEAEIDDRY
jgi:hypothetical protein